MNRLVLSALRQTVSLADRAGVTASELRTAYGQNRDPIRPVPLSLFVHLVNTAGPDVAAAPVAADRIARRLARSAAYERRAYYALLERAGYAMDRDLGRSREAAMAREEELLTAVLANVPVVEVHAPFPVDPHRVAASIERWL